MAKRQTKKQVKNAKRNSCKTYEECKRWSEYYFGGNGKLPFQEVGPCIQLQKEKEKKTNWAITRKPKNMSISIMEKKYGEKKEIGACLIISMK